MLITPDFSEMGGQFEPGTYVGIITASEQRTAKTSGNAYINWTVDIKQGGPTPISAVGQVRFNTMITGKGAFMLHALVKSAFGELPPAGQAFDTSMLHGKAVGLVLVNGTDQNNQPSGFSEVKTIISPEKAQATIGAAQAAQPLAQNTVAAVPQAAQTAQTAPVAPVPVQAPQGAQVPGVQTTAQQVVPAAVPAVG